MNLRHAAALALVGWYLIVPLVASDGRVDASARLWKWWKFQLDDSAQECRTFLSEFQQGPVTEAEWEGSRRAAMNSGIRQRSILRNCRSDFWIHFVLMNTILGSRKSRMKPRYAAVLDRTSFLL
jgi:hypothetical protein